MFFYSRLPIAAIMLCVALLRLTIRIDQLGANAPNVIHNREAPYTPEIVGNFSLKIWFLYTLGLYKIELCLLIIGGRVMMTLQLPKVDSYVEKVLMGETKTIRIPKGNFVPGDSITASLPGNPEKKIRLGIRAVSPCLLHDITPAEAEKEGFTVPGFCTSKAICESVEVRLDTDSLVFDRSSGTPQSRSMETIQKELTERVNQGCPGCLIKKDSKDLFLSYWKGAYGQDGNPEISRIEFELISRN
jgi:hypothetical protein